MSSSTPQQAFSVTQAAALLGFSMEHLRRLVAAGELRHARIGRTIRISRADLEEFYRQRGGGQLWKTDAPDDEGAEEAG